MSSLFQEFIAALNSEKDFKKFLHHFRDQIKQKKPDNNKSPVAVHPVNSKTMRRGYHFDKLRESPYLNDVRPVYFVTG